MRKVKMYLFLFAFWFTAYCGIVASQFLPSSDRVIRATVVGLDGVIVMLALLAVFRNRSFYGVKLFVLFLLSVVVTVIYSSDRFGLAEQFNGLRETLFYFSSLVVVYDLFMSEERQTFIRWMTISVIVFAIAQTPSSFYQFLKFGAGDLVGGTYGIRGGSGVVSQALFVICFYLMVRFASLEDESHFRIVRLLFILPLLIPCALNETKVSFVFLAGFLVLLVASRRQIYRAIPLLVMGAILAVLLNYYYSQNVEDTRNIFDEKYVERYLYSNTTEKGGDLPRFQRVTLMFKMMGSDVGSILFGMGYGVLGGGNLMDVSRMGRALYYLVNGSRILLFRVWIQGGLLSVLLVGAAMFMYMRRTPALTHTRKQFKRFLAFSLAIVWLYNEAILDRTFVMMVWFFIVWLSYADDDLPAIEEGSMDGALEHHG